MWGGSIDRLEEVTKITMQVNRKFAEKARDALCYFGNALMHKKRQKLAICHVTNVYVILTSFYYEECTRNVYCIVLYCILFYCILVCLLF